MIVLNLEMAQSWHRVSCLGHLNFLLTSMLSLIIIIYFYYIKVILQNKNICSYLKLYLKIYNEQYLKVAFNY